MNLLKTVSVVLLSFLFVCPQCEARPSTLAANMRTTYFAVHYDPSDPYLAKLMAGAAREELLRISRDLGVSVDRNRPFKLMVYTTHMDFIEAGGLEHSKFTVGTAASRDDTISVDASGAFAPAQQVLAHEITHAVIFRALGDRVSKLPLWLNEGLAEYQSEGFTHQDREIIADAAANGTLIPLKQLARGFPRDRTALAYAQSASAVEYMIREHGKTAPRKLLAALAAGGSLDRAMMEATGKTADQFAGDWYAAVTSRYWLVRLTRIGAGVIGVVMAILAVAAFLVRRKQKIEAARRWQQEEFEEALRRQLGNDWWR